MHINNQKLSFDIFTVGNLLNIFMEHDLNPLSAKVAKLRQDVILDQIDRSSLSGVISHLYSLPLDGRHVVLRF